MERPVPLLGRQAWAHISPSVRLLPGTLTTAPLPVPGSQGPGDPTSPTRPWAPGSGCLPARYMAGLCSVLLESLLGLRRRAWVSLLGFSSGGPSSVVTGVHLVNRHGSGSLSFLASSSSQAPVSPRGLAGVAAGKPGCAGLGAGVS